MTSAVWKSGGRASGRGAGGRGVPPGPRHSPWPLPSATSRYPGLCQLVHQGACCCVRKRRGRARATWAACENTPVPSTRTKRIRSVRVCARAHVRACQVIDLATGAQAGRRWARQGLHPICRPDEKSRSLRWGDLRDSTRDGGQGARGGGGGGGVEHDGGAPGRHAALARGCHVLGCCRGGKRGRGVHVGAI